MKIKRKKGNYRIIGFIAFITWFVSMLATPYINTVFPGLSVVKNAAYVFVLLLELLVLFYRKQNMNKQYILLLIWAFVILFSTFINHASYTAYLSHILPVIVTCLALIICRNREEIMRVLDIWCVLLFALLLVDLLTEILFPKGLYRSNFYSRNWFLGYKTNRLAYTFPLLVFYSYKAIVIDGRLHRKAILLGIVVLINILLSAGTAGAVAVTLYVLLLVLISRVIAKEKKSRVSMAFLNVFSKPGFFLPVYGVITLIIIFLQSQTLIQRIGLLFDKGDTLHGRLEIWERLIEALNGHWLLGLGSIDSQEYMQITGSVVNAHNIILTYIINGGIIGLIIIMYVIISTTKRADCMENYVISIYAFILLCIGVTSSALVFCPYFYAALLLPVLMSARRSKISIMSRNIRPT